MGYRDFMRSVLGILRVIVPNKKPVSTTHTDRSSYRDSIQGSGSSFWIVFGVHV